MTDQTPLDSARTAIIKRRQAILEQCPLLKEAEDTFLREVEVAFRRYMFALNHITETDWEKICVPGNPYVYWGREQVNLVDHVFGPLQKNYPLVVHLNIKNWPIPSIPEDNVETNQTEPGL